MTLLHGHSSFFVSYDGLLVATGASTARVADGAPWDIHVEAASLMDLLYAGSSAKFSTAFLASDLAAVVRQPIGYLSQVPSATNNWTMGVVLFG